MDDTIQELSLADMGSGDSAEVSLSMSGANQAKAVPVIATASEHDIDAKFCRNEA